MAGPEVAGSEPALTFWGQAAAGLMVGAVWALSWLYNLAKGRSEAEPGKHVVLEQAELADMTAVRELLRKLPEVIALQADLDQIKRDDAKILEILERLDRAEAIASGVREQLLQERLLQDGRRQRGG